MNYNVGWSVRCPRKLGLVLFPHLDLYTFPCVGSNCLLSCRTSNDSLAQFIQLISKGLFRMLKWLLRFIYTYVGRS